MRKENSCRKENRRSREIENGWIRETADRERRQYEVCCHSSLEDKISSYSLLRTNNMRKPNFILYAYPGPYRNSPSNWGFSSFYWASHNLAY